MLPESRQSPRIAACKLLKRSLIENGPEIAIKRVPVMYRLLEKFPDSPKNSRPPARATANEAALKRDEPVGKSAVGAVETTTVHTIFGRPVTSAGHQTPLRKEWRLFVLEGAWVGQGAVPPEISHEGVLASRGGRLYYQICLSSG
jgi:hypothetical protein